MTLPSGQVVEVDLGLWICLGNAVWFPGSSSTFLGPGVTPASPLPAVESEFCAQLHVGGEQGDSQPRGCSLATCSQEMTRMTMLCPGAAPAVLAPPWLKASD